jgi:hypothetical protein
VARSSSLGEPGRRELLAVAGLALLAAAPRLANLLALDPFVDELNWVIRGIGLSGSPGLSNLVAPLRDGRPPLHAWLVLVAGQHVDNGFLAGRLAAALPGIAATLALYALGRALFCREVGVVAAVLWALGPYAVFFSRIGSDDSLLTFWSIVAALAGVCLARRPTVMVGAISGLVVGLAVLTKTLGLLAAVAPPLAAATLARPGSRRHLVGPLVAMCAAATLVFLPLVPWLPQLQRQVELHAEFDGQGDGPSGEGAVTLPFELGRFVRADLFSRNFAMVTEWLADYVGVPALACAALGSVLAGVVWRRELLYLALICIVQIGLLVNFMSTPFSRYLLPFSYPLYLFAGVAIVWLAVKLSLVVAALARAPRAGSLIRVGLPTLLLLVVLAPTLPFTWLIAMQPGRAPIPAYDRLQHFDQWYALYGLARIVDILRAEGASNQSVVLIPPRSSRTQAKLPHQALLFYLRGDPSVRFREIDELGSARTLTVLRRRLCSESPTFLVLSGTYTESAATPGDVPQYTRSFEAALRRDLPEADLVLRVDRPNGPSWLSLYRVDQQPPPAEGCPPAGGDHD